MTSDHSTPHEARGQNGGGWAAETTFHIRYAETDQMGIVHHSAYVPWLEEARSALSRRYGRSYADFERAGYALAVTEMSVRFVTPARYDRAVTVRIRVSQVRSRQVCFDYEVLDAETSTRLASGFTAHVCIDRAGRPARIPPDWQEFWAGLMSR
jgi:acyl-CoA thioester hydrolase